MAKQLKIKIKNTQLAKAAGLGKVKAKLSKEKKVPEKIPKNKSAAKEEAEETLAEDKPRRIKARTKSAFAEQEEVAPAPVEEKVEEPPAALPEVKEPTPPVEEPPQKLGPTGKHIKDLLPAKKEAPKKKEEKPKETKPAAPLEDRKKGKKVRELKDLKPRRSTLRPFDGRDRKGLKAGDDDRWRKKRNYKSSRRVSDEPIIRPTTLKIRLPILVKDLAAEMKLKAAELVQKLFMQL